MDCHFKVERLSDFSVLDSFECGVAQMDNFIHGNLKFCDAIIKQTFLNNHS